VGSTNHQPPTTNQPTDRPTDPANRHCSAVMDLTPLPGRAAQGTITVNKKSLIEYFQRDFHIEEVALPFARTETAAKYDVWCTVKGGGQTGQAGAIRLGVSRCLEKWDPSLRASLKQAGMLTRDVRRVERKKAGQPKARKKKQWVKR
jgi:small subunit ribosomal protein S9